MSLLGDDGQRVRDHEALHGARAPRANCVSASRCDYLSASSFIPSSKNIKKLSSCYRYFKERIRGGQMYFFPRLNHQAEAGSQAHL